jgi:hypothetical protein
MPIHEIIDRTAWAMADGNADETDIAKIVRTARRHDVNHVIVDVLADRDAPYIARSRAFGAVATALRFTTPTPLPLRRAA